MKIVLHTCCGPCAAYPLEQLRQKGMDVQGFFFNPNIHPFQEFKRRLAALDDLAAEMRYEVEVIREYGLKEYMRRVVFHEENRCGICYEMRLSRTAEYAAQTGADAFTTTLLYSKYQNHQQICQLAEQLAKQYSVSFYYEDFRAGWQEGIDRSIEMGLYRQPYCGCIYSEQERYDKKWRKRQRKLL
ncbi:MAG: epoxyqueuosine reductase QueH [Desulfobulbaceae bacterium]|uniref:Epoxyqueuosine reductase QueH n=1 Tax=Candidatus Desulfobia pelagia TaxID=2841692 RepID=A0A8J6NEW1_9BACT|nr:epoxyqueuosine reductase QueH [Candidatus Desulfobia pelagia]